MKKEFSIWLSIISLLLSIISTCVAVWRSPELGFDYQGVITGVLSLLVTVLIGWQIYNYVYVNGNYPVLTKWFFRLQMIE